MSGFIPIQIKRVKKCNRCGLKYPIKNTLCYHCTHLNKNEVAILKAKFKKQQKENTKLGKLFFLAMIIIIVIMAI